MNILELITKQGITPKRYSSAKGGEYGSPCPKCGGDDRFRIWPGQGEHGSYWCRQCDLGGDAVSYLREIEGRSCPDAHADLGLECSSTTCPVVEKCRKGQGRAPRRDESAKRTPRAPDAAPDWIPSGAEPPADLWRQQAARLVEWAHARLLQDADALAYLAGRGLDRQAVEQFRLGLVPDTPKVNYRTRASWGLPEEISDRTGKPKKLWIPPGILIPYQDAEGIHRIRIRRWEGQPRYYWLPGSGNDVILVNPEARAFVVVESDLDALLVVRHAGDLVGAVPLGTSSAKPKQEAAAALRRSLAILVALDADDAGAKASRWWQSSFPQAERWPVPAGSDPGEYFKDHGGDIRTWILEGLPPGLRVQASKPVEKPEEAPEPTPEPEPAPAVRNTRTTGAAESGPAEVGYIKGKSKNGYIYFVTERPAQAAHLRELFPGEAVFTHAELRAMKGMSPEEAEKFILVKRMSPEAEILETRPIREEVTPEKMTYDPSRQRRARQG